MSFNILTRIWKFIIYIYIYIIVLIFQYVNQLALLFLHKPINLTMSLKIINYYNPCFYSLIQILIKNNTLIIPIATKNLFVNSSKSDIILRRSRIAIIFKIKSNYFLRKKERKKEKRFFEKGIAQEGETRNGSANIRIIIISINSVVQRLTVVRARRTSERIPRFQPTSAVPRARGSRATHAFPTAIRCVAAALS